MRLIWQRRSAPEQREQARLSGQSRQAAVDDEVVTGNVGGVIRSEENNRARHFAGQADATERNTILPMMAMFLKSSADHWRIRCTGTDSIDTYAVNGVIRRASAGEIDDRSLRRIVNAHAVVCAHAGD